jgi:hypothetical protein
VDESLCLRQALTGFNEYQTGGLSVLGASLFFTEWSMQAFNPQPSDWYSATCSFAHIGGWGFAHLEDGTEIFLPAPIKSGITSVCLAVRIKLSPKPGRRPEAIEAMALEDYYKLLDEDIPGSPGVEATRPARDGEGPKPGRAETPRQDFQ